MYDEDEPQYEKRARAGLIPYIFTETGELKFLTMVSSDPKFGGLRPMISKGKIELGETELDAAVREAIEELGFKIQNACGTLKEVISEHVIIHSGSYNLTVFGVQVIDMYNFNKWNEETEYTVWLTADEFRTNGRKDHIKYIEILEKLIKNT